MSRKGLGRYSDNLDPTYRIVACIVILEALMQFEAFEKHSSAWWRRKHSQLTPWEGGTPWMPNERYDWQVKADAEADARWGRLAVIPGAAYGGVRCSLV